MVRTGVVVLTGLAILVGTLAGIGRSPARDTAPSKPDRPAGPLEVAPHELSPPGHSRHRTAAHRSESVVAAEHGDSLRLSADHLRARVGWGSRSESDVLLSDIASTGFVVAATDDVSRDLPDPAADPADEAVRAAPFRAFSAQDLAGVSGGE